VAGTGGERRGGRSRFPVVAAIALGVVVIGGLALWFGVLPGPQTAIDDHLDELARVVEATRPDAASVVASYRNDVCDSGVEGVGTTFRATQSLGAIQQHARRELRRAGWKISRSDLDRRDGRRVLSATRRFSWARAFVTVEPGDHTHEIDVIAEFNC
jgi:hypothetical protein